MPQEKLITPETGKHKRNNSNNLIRLSYLYKKLNVMNESEARKESNCLKKLKYDIQIPQTAKIKYQQKFGQPEESTKSETNIDWKKKGSISQNNEIKSKNPCVDFNYVWEEESKGLDMF